jgi:hypothetical protein
MNNFPNKLTGRDTVGIKTSSDMMVIYYKKVDILSASRPVNISDIYILLDNHGRLYISSEAVIFEVISNNRKNYLLTTRDNHTGFSLKGGGKHYYIRNKIHGFTVDYDQYGNMVARAHYKFDSPRSKLMKNNPTLLFNPIELSYIKKKQLTQIKNKKGRYKRRENGDYSSA